MAKKDSLDNYVQVYRHELAETGAGLGNEEPMVTSITARDRKGILVSRIEYAPSRGLLDELAADDDEFWFYLTCIRHATIPNNPDKPGIIDWNDIRVNDIPAAGPSQLIITPIIKEYKEPLILHPAALYFGIKSSGIVGTWPLHILMHYKMIDLSDDLWRELFESALMQNIA
jgi:hypothetical protein